MTGEDHLESCQAVVAKRATNEDSVLMAELFDFNPIVQDDGSEQAKQKNSNSWNPTKDLLQSFDQMKGFRRPKVWIKIRIRSLKLQKSLKT